MNANDIAEQQQIIAETIEANVGMFKALYDRGAFLIEATAAKTPMVDIYRTAWEEDADGNMVLGDDGRAKILPPQWRRSTWPALEQHIRRQGRILYYNPGAQGLVVLDFDPMVPDWLSAIEDAIGAPPLGMWRSSGKVKPATNNKPSGIGGHAVWKIDPAAQTMLREFSVEPGGFSVGQVFCGHKGYGFIVYNPKALIDAMDADDCEIIDASRIPQASGERTATDKWGSNWRPNPDSRHNSTISILASIVNKSTNIEDLNTALGIVETTFKESIGADRDVSDEWERMVTKAHDWWEKRQREMEANSNITNSKSFAELMGDKPNTPDVDEPEEDRPLPQADVVELTDFRNRASSVIGTEHETVSAATEFCNRMGVMVLRDFGCNSPNFAAGMKNLGVEARFVLPDEVFQLRIPGNIYYNDWVDFHSKDVGPARYVYQYGMMTSMVGLRKPAKKDAKYTVAGIPWTWWRKEADIYSEFVTHKGKTAVPIVNLLEQMVKRVFNEVEIMSDEEKDRHEYIASNWLADMDNLKIADVEVPSARAFSRYLATMLAIRLLQNLPEFKAVMGIRSQRHIPVIAGEPGCGKSALLKAVLPEDGVWEPVRGRRVNSIFKDTLHMNRDTHGRIMNVYDELAGVYNVSIDKIKEFVTDTHPVYDLKHLNSQARERTSFLCGTVNTLSMPKDAAFRERFFFVCVKRTDPTTPNSTQGKLVYDEIASKREEIIKGGMVIASRIMAQAIDSVDPRDPTFVSYEPAPELLEDQSTARERIDDTDDPWKQDVQRMIAGQGKYATICEFSRRSSHSNEVFIRMKDAAKEVGLIKPNVAAHLGVVDNEDEQWRQVKIRDRMQLSRLSKMFLLFNWKRVSDRRLPDGSKDTVYTQDRTAQLNQMLTYKDVGESGR